MDTTESLIEQRNNLDFEAVRLLQQMDDDGLMTVPALVAALSREEGVSKSEAKSVAEDIVEKFTTLIERRRELDQQIIRAAVAR